MRGGYQIPVWPMWPSVSPRILPSEFPFGGMMFQGAKGLSERLRAPSQLVAGPGSPEERVVQGGDRPSDRGDQEQGPASDRWLPSSALVMRGAGCGVRR